MCENRFDSYIRFGRRWWIILGVFVGLPVLLGIWTKGAESAVLWVPDYCRVEIGGILERTKLTGRDYQVLWEQTGVGQTAIIQLQNRGQIDILLKMQDQMFEEDKLECWRTTPVSYEERTVRGIDGRRKRQLMAPLEDGDVLITPCSHTLGFRNGHAALVVSAAEGLTLESTMIGRNSSIQSIDSWKTFPCFVVLRLKGVSKEIRAQIAKSAKETLYDIPYGLLKGIQTPKYSPETKETQCAHLVWQAYAKYGFDIDSNQGMIVTPQDIANSPLFETIQTTGLNPQTPWPPQ